MNAPQLCFASAKGKVEEKYAEKIISRLDIGLQFPSNIL